MRALLISTYEMGRQPFGLASPAAWLRAAGWDVACARPDPRAARRGPRRGRRSRRLLPADAHGDAAGGAGHRHACARHQSGARACARTACTRRSTPTALRALGVDDDARRRVRSRPDRPWRAAWPPASARRRPRRRRASLPRLHFLVPDRAGLPPLARYATLQHARRHAPGRRLHRGEPRLQASLPALSRSCRSTTGSSASCSPRSCWPTSPAQVAAGAAAHHLRRSRLLQRPDARACASSTRCTTRIPASPTTSRSRSSTCCSTATCCRVCAATGCAFVTSAVESIDDDVLARLEKGHTRADFVEAVGLCRDAGLTLVPTFVAFHPWTTLERLLRSARHASSRSTWSITSRRFSSRSGCSIPQGSRLLDLDGRRERSSGRSIRRRSRTAGRIADPRVDELQREVARSRRRAARRPIAGAVFDEIAALAHDAGGPAARRRARPARDRATVPYLNEPWYC